MNKIQKRILKEISALEKETFKDVEKTANKINKERRKQLNAMPYPEYQDKHKTESFINEEELLIIIKKNIKNGSITASA